MSEELKWLHGKLQDAHHTGAEKWRVKAVLRYLLKTRHAVKDEQLTELDSLIEQTEIWPADDGRK